MKVRLSSSKNREIGEALSDTYSLVNPIDASPRTDYPCATHLKVEYGKTACFNPQNTNGQVIETKVLFNLEIASGLLIGADLMIKSCNSREGKRKKNKR